MGRGDGSGKVIVEYDDFHDRFNSTVPTRIKHLIDETEFRKSVTFLNATIAKAQVKSKFQQKIRLGIVLVSATAFIISLIVAVGVHSTSAVELVVPPAIFFSIFLLAGILSLRYYTDAGHIAASSIELVLRTFNEKHSAKGLAWRLHKRTAVDDEAFSDDSLTTSETPFWIEIEISETDFSIHEEEEPTKPPPPILPPSRFQLPQPPSPSQQKQLSDQSSLLHPPGPSSTSLQNIDDIEDDSKPKFRPITMYFGDRTAVTRKPLLTTIQEEEEI